MSNVKVGRKVEILNVETFNDNVVEVGCIAEIVAVNDKHIVIDRHDWKLSQVSCLSQEGEAWKLVPATSSAPSVEPPTINSEPFITIKGVEVGSSLERALNLVVAVRNGDSVRERCDEYGIATAVQYALVYINDSVEQLEIQGLDWYILKSEEESKLNKEALDKEIQELENKLQELKTKRGY